MRVPYYRWVLLFILTGSVVGCAALPPAAAAPAAAASPPTSAAGAGGTTIVAIAPPAGPQCTIFDFLGLTKICNELGMVANCGMNLLGNAFPGLASGLPMSNLTNAAAANSSNPAVAAAAGAKADENAAPQKVAALRYLGTIGCGGCYPEIEKALLAGLDDCIEVVRFEAASALGETSRNQCRYCTSNRCCSPNVRKKLIQIATETNDKGCYVEPSGRVRRMARVALCNCCGDAFEDEPQPIPSEGPSSDSVVPPRPDPSVTEASRERRPSEHFASAANAASKNLIDDRSERNSRPIKVASSPEATAKARDAVVKQYDSAHKAPDIIVRTSETPAKPSFPPVKVDVTTAASPIARRDQSGPRIRWERAAVSIYRFETKDDAVKAMDFIRRKSLGEDPETPDDANLKYVTTREVGWTRPQDVKSPELAKMLFELPVGQISPVIEVGDTLLVCRVLEREPPDPGVRQVSATAVDKGWRERSE